MGPIYVTALEPASSTLIEDQRYELNTQPLQLPVPKYTFVPVDAENSLSWALGSDTPSFVELVETAEGVFEILIEAT